MLWVLLANRFRILFYFIRNKNNPRARKNLLRIVALLILPYWIFQSSYNLYSSWQFLPGFNAGVIANYLFIMFGGLFFLMIMSGIPLALHYHYLSNDRALLAVQPISSITVYLYKTTELCLTNSSLFALIGLPAIAAAMIFLKIPVLFFIPLVLGLVLFVTIPSGIAALLASVMALVMPVKRTRQATSILFGLIIIGIWAAIQFFNTSRLDPYSADFDRGLYSRILDANTMSHTGWLPAAWLAKSIMAAAKSDLHAFAGPFGLLLISSVMLISVAGLLLKNPGTRALNKPVNRTTEPGTSVTGKSTATRDFPLWFNLALRDYKIQFRDSRFVTQFFFYLAVVIVFPMLVGESLRIENETLAPLLPFIFMLAVVSLMAAGMAARSIPLEKRSFFYNLTGPLPSGVLALSKLVVPIAAAILVTLAGLLSASLAGNLKSMSPGMLLFTLIHIGVVSAIGLWIGSYFRTSQWDNPRQMLGESGNLVLNIVVWLYSGMVVLAGYLLLPLNTWVAFLTVLVISAVTGLTVMTLNIKRFAIPVD